MARYIDADKMIYEIRHNLWDWSCVDDIRTSLVLKQTITDIENQPSEDVAPVIHAHWKYRYDTGIYQTEFLCSRCKELIETYSCTVDEVEYEYCPHCGAKMDGGEL